MEEKKFNAVRQLGCLIFLYQKSVKLVKLFFARNIQITKRIQLEIS